HRSSKAARASARDGRSRRTTGCRRAMYASYGLLDPSEHPARAPKAPRLPWEMVNGAPWCKAVLNRRGIAASGGRRYLTGMTDAVPAPSTEVERLSILIVPDPVLRQKARPVGPRDLETVRAL